MSVNDQNDISRAVVILIVGLLVILGLVLWFLFTKTIFEVVLTIFLLFFVCYSIFVLIDQNWYRLFILGVVPVPFFSLVFFSMCLRDFDSLTQNFTFLESIGQTGFSLIVGAITLLEIIVILIGKNLLFGNNKRKFKNGKFYSSNFEAYGSFITPQKPQNTLLALEYYKGPDYPVINDRVLKTTTDYHGKRNDIDTTIA